MIIQLQNPSIDLMMVLIILLLQLWVQLIIHFQPKNNQITAFSMYPTPTSLGYVTISSKSNSSIEVSVFDVLGKQAIKETVGNNVLNVSQLKSDMYIMKVSQDDATTTQKLVIR